MPADTKVLRRLSTCLSDVHFDLMSGKYVTQGKSSIAASLISYIFISEIPEVSHRKDREAVAGRLYQTSPHLRVGSYDVRLEGKAVLHAGRNKKPYVGMLALMRHV